MANELGIPLLGQIPIVQSIREGGDSGKPVAVNQDSISGSAFHNLAVRLIQEVDTRNTTLEPTRKVEIK